MRFTSVLWRFFFFLFAGDAFITIATLRILFFLFLFFDVMINILMNLLCRHSLGSFRHHWGIHVLRLLLESAFQVAWHELLYLDVAHSNPFTGRPIILVNLTIELHLLEFCNHANQVIWHNRNCVDTRALSALSVMGRGHIAIMRKNLLSFSHSLKIL